MKMLKKAATLALLMAGILGTQVMAAPASDFEFHGYARSGAVYNLGLKSVGAGENLGSVGRLGNENSSPYAETEFVKRIAAGSAWSKYHVLFAIGSSGKATWADNPTVRQAYVEMGGLKMDPSLTFWAGKRFYGRDDIHIIDKYWRNMSGTGAGVQGLLGGNLDLALVNGNNDKKDKDGANFANLNFDARYKMGAFEFEGVIAPKAGTEADGTGVKGETSIQGAVVYGLSNFFNIGSGFSRVALQVGLNSDAGSLSSTEWSPVAPQSNAVRLLAFGVTDLGAWQVMPEFFYESTMPKTGNAQSTLSLACRPQLVMSENFVLAFEGGLASIDQGTDAKGLAYKFTVAPTLKVDTAGFWNRPELRAFVTYIGQDEKLGKLSATGKDASELRMGVQSEVWF